MYDPTKMKVCIKCHKKKYLYQFSKFKANKDGYRCWCKNCYSNVTRVIEARKKKQINHYKLRNNG